MRIVKMQPNFEYNAYEIYVSGCRRGCIGCHNPQLQSFEYGKEYENTLSDIERDLVEFDFDYVWLLGGDFLDQDSSECNLFMTYLHNIREENRRDFKIVLFTGFDEEELRLDQEVFDHIDYLKVGRFMDYSESYVEPLLGIKLASLNQKVINLKDELDACLIKHEYKERK